MPIDRDCDSNYLSGLDVTQFWPGATIDGSRRQMEQNIDDAGRFAAEQARINALELRPDAGQARERREQRIKHGWPHGMSVMDLMNAQHPAPCYHRACPEEPLG